MTVKTSENCPLLIGELPVDGCGGVLGLTLCPGKIDVGRQWNRNLHHDLVAIKDWGATTIVTLIEDFEFSMLQVPTLGQEIQRTGIYWVHLPIRDVSIPDDRFAKGWKIHGPKIRDRLDAGERILIHCRGGIGRTGLVAGQILVERGAQAVDAYHRVRRARPGAIETDEQKAYIFKLPSRQGCQKV